MWRSGFSSGSSVEQRTHRVVELARRARGVVRSGCPRARRGRPPDLAAEWTGRTEPPPFALAVALGAPVTRRSVRYYRSDGRQCDNDATGTGAGDAHRSGPGDRALPPGFQGLGRRQPPCGMAAGGLPESVARGGGRRRGSQRRVAPAALRRRLGGSGLARRIRGPRPRPRAPGGDRRRVRPSAGTATHRVLRDRNSRPRADPVRHARAAQRAPAPHPVERGHVVPGVLGTELGQRSRVARETCELATGTTTSSTVRRCGPRMGAVPIGAFSWPEPALPSRGIAGSRCSSLPCRRPESSGDRSAS